MAYKYKYIKYKKKYMNLVSQHGNGTYNNRIELYNMLKHIDFISDKNCNIVYKKTIPGMKYKYLSEGHRGIIYIIYLEHKGKVYKVAVKHSPITKTKIVKKSQRYREAITYRNCTRLVVDKVTQNLPLMYGYQLCDMNVLMYNEYASGDGFKWLGKEHNISEWKSLLFQIWHGLYVIRKKLSMVHNDMHMGNILYHKVKKGGHWKYVMNNQTYYVPNEGHVYTLWDFGSTESIKYEGKKKALIVKRYNYNADVYRFNILLYKNILKVIIGRYTIEELSSMLKKDVLLKIKKDVESDVKYYKKSDALTRKWVHYYKLAEHIFETGMYDSLYQKRKHKAKKDLVFYPPPTEIINIILSINKHYDHKRIKKNVLRWTFPYRWDYKSLDMLVNVPNPETLIEQYLPEFTQEKDVVDTFTCENFE